MTVVARSHYFLDHPSASLLDPPLLPAHPKILQLLANNTSSLEWDLLDLWDLDRDLLLGPDLERDLLDREDLLDLGLREHIQLTWLPEKTPPCRMGPSVSQLPSLEPA